MVSEDCRNGDALYAGLTIVIVHAIMKKSIIHI